MQPLNRHLSHLENSGLIAIANLLPELEYLFRHALVQDTAYDSLLRQDRRKLHRIVGEALERSYPDRLDELAAQLAAHFAEAGQDQRALVYYTRAAKQAARRYANAEAAMYYGSASEIAKRVGSSMGDLITLHMAWGRSLELSSDHESAYQVYESLIQIGDQRGDAAPKLAAMAAQAVLRCTPSPMMDVTQGIALAKAGLALAREVGDRASEARILWTLGLGHYFTSEPDKSIAYSEQALAIARELNLRELLCYVLSDLGRAYAAAGRMHDAGKAVEEGSAGWREIGNLTMLSDSLNTLTEIQSFTGNYDLMLSASAESIQTAEMIGNNWGQGHALWGHGMALMEQGHYSQALRIGERAFELVKAARLTVVTAVCSLELARLHGLLGNPKKGLEYITEGQRYFDTSASIFHPWLLSIAAQLTHQSGDLAQARAQIEQARKDVDYGNFSTHSMFLFAAADATLCMAEGKPAEALAALTPALVELQANDLWAPLPDLLDIKGRILIAQGRHDEARAALTEARHIAERIGAKRPLWSILHALALIEPDPQAAAALMHESRGIVQSIIDGLADRPDLAASFAAQPEVRAVMENIPTSS